MSEIKRFPFTRILGWSVTRYNEFSLCKRRYYYQYYGKHDPEWPTERIKALKELTTIPMETGGIVHHVIRTLLTRFRDSNEAIDRERFYEYALRSTRGHVSAKRFAEVHYGEIDAVDPEEMYPKVQSCLENLLESDRYKWIQQEALATVKEWVIEPPGYGETRIQDLKAYCKVDFLFPVGEELYIMDWKTGKQDAEKHNRQLTGYATWASYHFETTPDRIRPVIAYLHPTYEEIRPTLNEFDVQEFAHRVRVETEEMYAFCSDVGKNLPLEKTEFPRVDHPKICPLCTFRELCFPEGVHTLQRD
jgi:hypothetical protein